MKYCPTCNQNYSSSQRFCLNDGQLLSLPDPYHLVGRTLMDKYRIDALVGIGGMGAVYSGRHLMINRQVAFKILLPNLALGNERLIEMFQREAEMAGQLSHENIVDIKDAGRTSEGIAYIVMEWLDGVTLDEVMEREPILGFNRTAIILHQVAAALDHAHERHIIHRDLKPSNVMLVKNADGREIVKVVDFGIAKATSESADSHVSRLIGTPHYASPEQFSLGSHIDGRSDIYSLGVLLFQMLSGRLPFTAQSPAELIRMQKTETPPGIRLYCPETPVEVEQLIFRMLSKEPSARPQSAKEAADIFERTMKKALERGKDGVVTSLYDSPLTGINTMRTTDDAAAIAATIRDLNATTDESPPAKTARGGDTLTVEPQPRSEAERSEGAAMAAEATNTADEAGGEAAPAMAQREVSAKQNSGKRVTAALLTQVITALLLMTLIVVAATLIRSRLLDADSRSAEPVRAELMSYYLEISSDQCRSWARGTGDEPLESRQAFRFHFKPRESGYLYIIAQNEKNVPTVFLSAQPDPDTGVKSNFVEAGNDYSFPSGEGNCIGISENEPMMAFTVIFSPTLLASPSFLAEPAMRELNATEQHELKLWLEQRKTGAPEITPNSKEQMTRVTVVRKSGDAGNPVIFDLPVKRR